MKFMITIAAALVLSGAVVGAATTRLIVLRAGDKVAVHPRLVCLVSKNNIACGSIDHPHSYNAVTDRRGVTITLNGKVIFLRRYK